MPQLTDIVFNYLMQSCHKMFFFTANDKLAKKSYEIFLPSNALNSVYVKKTIMFLDFIIKAFLF